MRAAFLHGSHAGMSIHFGLDSNGRFDASTSFAFSEPYPGKTREGVGLGSAPAAVHDALGDPHFSNVGASGQIHDRYAMDRARSGFLYDEDDRVTGITMNGPL